MNTFSDRKDFKILLALLCCCLSCAKPETQRSLRTYPDLPGLMRQEAERLTQHKVHLRKTVLLSGTSTTTTLPAPNWQDELKPFMEYDLNADALRDWINTDTTISDGITFVHYQSRDTHSRLKSVRIWWNGADADSVQMEAGHSGIYGEEFRLLTYGRRSGYRMIIQNHPSLGKDTDLEVTGVFEPGQ